MAAVRARRPREEGKRRRKGRAAAPAYGGQMPRLAMVKLNGGVGGGGGPQVSGRSLVLALAGVVLVAGAAIAGATWIGGSLFDAGEAFERSADGAAANVGFRITDVEVAGEGVSPARIAEVRSVIIPEGGQSLLSLDPLDVKTRVESLDWVEDVRVRRLWPSTLHVEVKRREAFARWQEDRAVSVIDLNGERLLSERAADHRNLPLVVGRGAGPEAQPLLEVLEELPHVRAHLAALIRVGDRRWNMETTSGQTVRLPEQSPELALARLETLQIEHQVLDRPVAILDLRVPGRLAVRVLPHLEGGPAALATGGA